MKILYGVQGTGNGHISRARAINKYLKKLHIEVDFLFSGRARENYFDMEEFGDWRCHQGLTFLHQAGKLQTLETWKRARILDLLNDIRMLDLNRYDLVLSDFEPITAWAARLRNKTCIGIGHQYAFQYNVPRRGDNFVTRALMQYFAPCKISLGLHWHHFGQPILPPIAETHSTKDPVEPGKILVYLGFEETDDVLAYLEQFSDYKFVYYGPFERYERCDHIHLKPLSREGFKYDLATSEGVICNAGFELGSEAIQLGKKLLVKPLQGQLEQLSNAKALEQLGLAMTMDSLDASITLTWLQHFSSRQVHYPNVAEAIAEWIHARGWEKPEGKSALVEKLWRSDAAAIEPAIAA
jgi:uncharacterized protein (TIGR00661 family)